MNNEKLEYNGFADIITIIHRRQLGDITEIEALERIEAKAHKGIEYIRAWAEGRGCMWHELSD